jgi:hypothetical protein
MVQGNYFEIFEIRLKCNNFSKFEFTDYVPLSKLKKVTKNNPNNKKRNCLEPLYDHNRYF